MPDQAQFDTPDALGSAIKTKYPQYESLSNKDLSQKILTKYPQYWNHVNTDAFAKSGISKSAAGAPVQTQGSLSANKKPEGWFEQAEHDLTQGGTRTVVGRGLGVLQGRGDKGFTGTESGVSKGAADIAGSPAVGALHVAQGISETVHGHPLKGAVTQAKGYMEASTLPSMLMGGPEAKAAVEAVPSKEAGAKLLNIVMKDASDIPVTLKNSTEHLQRLAEMKATGGGSTQAINKLLARTRNPTLQEFFKKGPTRPMTYKEARDFYSNITSLTAKDAMGLNPKMKRQLGIVAQSLKMDIGNAAAEVGRQAEYYAGLKEYSKALKLAKVANKMSRYAVKAGLTAAGAGGIYEGAKKMGLLASFGQ